MKECTVKFKLRNCSEFAVTLVDFRLQTVLMNGAEQFLYLKYLRKDLYAEIVENQQNPIVFYA